MDPFPQDYYQSQENWKTNVTEGGGRQDFPTVVVSLNRFRLLSLSASHTNEGTNQRFNMKWCGWLPFLLPLEKITATVAVNAKGATEDKEKMC